MQIDDLNAATAKLSADVDTLLASGPQPGPDLSGVIAAIQGIDAKVVAATGTATPPVVASKVATAGNPTLPS